MAHLNYGIIVVLAISLLLPSVLAITPEQLRQFDTAAGLHDTDVVTEVRISQQMIDRNARNLVFGSIVHIPGLRHVSNESIVHIAIQAHHAATPEFQAYKDSKQLGEVLCGVKTRKKRPGVTSVVQIDDTAYISTSMVGVSLFYLDPPESGRARYLDQGAVARDWIAARLQECQAATICLPVDAGLGHRNAGKCGECMALLAFVQRSGGSVYPENARMVSVAFKRKSQEVEIVAPCSGNRLGCGAFGCLESLPSENLKVIGENTAEESFDVPAAGIVVTPICFP